MIVRSKSTIHDNSVHFLDNCLQFAVAALVAGAALGVNTGSVAHAATFAATPAADAVDAHPGDGSCATATGVCTLRAAIQEANALDGPDTVMLQAGTYTLTLIGAGEDAAATGDLDITSELTIAGPAGESAVIDGNRTDRVFDALAQANLTISRVTIQNGNATGAAGTAGGGVRNTGMLTVIASTISRNTAADGAGIANIDMGLAHLTNVTIASNAATASGGGVGNFDSATITLTNVTISGNAAVTGGGIDNFGTAHLTNTIVANSLAGGNCAGSLSGFTSLGHNLFGIPTCLFSGPSDFDNSDPKLGPLQGNGGPTSTQALLPGSLAIDAGDNTDCPATDQRGEPRPTDGNMDGSATCDIGAYEVPGPMPPTPTPTATASPTDTPSTETPSPSPTDTPASPTVTPLRPSLIIGTATGKPGEQVSFSVTLGTGGGSIAATNNDVSFDSLNTPIARQANGTPDCAVNPALPDVAAAFVFRPNGCTATACTGVFAAVFPTFPINPIADGAILYTCTVSISPVSVAGQYPLTISRVVLGNPEGFPIPGAIATDGKIVVVAPPTATETPTQTRTASPTRTETSTPTPSATPTVTQTLTPTPIHCVGDCDGLGSVTVNEIIKMVNIALSNANISTCPAAAPNHDGKVTVVEIVKAVNNVLSGCPKA